MTPSNLLFAALFLACGGGSGTTDTGTTADSGTVGTTDTAPVDETCHDNLVLSGGKSFGECGGTCIWAVTLSDNAARLIVSDWDGTVHADNSGVITPGGLSAACGAANALAGDTLDSVYGCPDCADGGASNAAIERSGIRSVHEWETGNPPEILADVAALLDELMDALDSCNGTSKLAPGADCTPL